ncbi:MAG: hypothetical protein WB767_16520 [Nocardioides sp.]
MTSLNRSLDRRLTRRVAATAAPLLLALSLAGSLAGSLTACGGDDEGGNSDSDSGGRTSSVGDAPNDAQVEEFCATFQESNDVTDGAGIKAFADKLAAVGTPDDLTDEQREGFEVFVGVAQGVDEGSTLDELEDPDVSDEEEAAVTAFIGYATTNCADELLGEVPTDQPS